MNTPTDITISPGLWTVDSAKKLDDILALGEAIGWYGNTCNEEHIPVDVFDAVLFMFYNAMVAMTLSTGSPIEQVEISLIIKHAIHNLQQMPPVKELLHKEDSPTWFRDLGLGENK